MTLSFAPASDPSLPLHVLEQSDFESWLTDQPDHIRAWVAADGFSGALGQTLLVPGTDGNPQFALAGYGSAAKRVRKRFPLAAAAESLPKGTYHIASGVPADVLEAECLGWLMTGYAFDRYAAQSPANATLIAPEGVDARRIEIMANAEALTRDLVNTPASDMGPAQLQHAVEALAREHGADISVITGDALLEQNFPMIHAVGRAAEQAPRLIEMTNVVLTPHLGGGTHDARRAARLTAAANVAAVLRGQTPPNPVNRPTFTQATPPERP